MGLFGSIGNIFSRAVTAVATGGASEIIRAVAPSSALPQVAQNLLAPSTLGQIASHPVTSLLTRGVSTSLAPAVQPNFVPLSGGQPMAFNIGGLLGQVGTILGGSQLPALQTVGQLSSLAGAFVPQPTARPIGAVGVAQPMPVGLPAQRGGSITQSAFNAGSRLLARLGIQPRSVSGFTSALRRVLSSISSLARRTPSGTIISLLVGLGLTALEATELAVWHSHKKRRRMNPANSKALRRSVRRIQSFHKLCRTADVLKARGRSRSSSRCGTCRKNPCRC